MKEKTLERIADALLYMWQLPQNLLGLLLVGWYRMIDKGTERLAVRGRRGEVLYRTDRMPGGVSLGRYIIVRRNVPDTINHELGHSVQSVMTGWLYLLIIGLPSAIHNLWHRRHPEADYYDFYAERWADRLGGVGR